MESLKSLLKLALLSEPNLDWVCDPADLFRFMLCDCVGKYVSPGSLACRSGSRFVGVFFKFVWSSQVDHLILVTVFSRSI